MTPWFEEREHFLFKSSAVFAIGHFIVVAKILEAIDELDSSDILEGADDDETLGEFDTDCGCIFAGVTEHTQRYFDYEAYGKDIRLEFTCCFTSYGAVIDNR